MKRFLLAIPLVFSLATPRLTLSAQQRAPSKAPAEPGSELTVILLTMGVGEQVWEQFGHNAIWIRDMSRPPSAGGPTDSVYHWGLFDFAQPHFIPRFLKGEMLYSMGGFSLTSTLEDYHRLDRSVWAQELDLTPAQRLALRDYIRWNEQPEHRGYYYDYYRDNCSTRVRDALDRVLGGMIRTTFGSRPSGQTYRSHTLRLTQVGPLLATGIDIGAGRPTDRELTAWEEMFLPRQLHDGLRELRITDATGASRPLVKREAVPYRSKTHEEPQRAPRWVLPFTLLGLLVGAAFTLLGFKAARGGARARFWTGVLFAVWAFTAGILGVLLTLLWTVTHHVAAHENENLLLFNPLWLVLAVVAPMTAVKGRLARFTRGLAMGLAVIAIAAPLLHVVGLSRQSNLEIIGLALPAALAIAWSVYRGTSAR
jgi:hypothetical protein